jgi:DNA-binding XRE family transcriptional regulator
MPIMDMQELKTKRSSVKLSQAKLAELLNISVETIKSWEQGKNPISKITEIAINKTISQIEAKQRQSQRIAHIQKLASKPYPTPVPPIPQP